MALHHRHPDHGSADSVLCALPAARRYLCAWTFAVVAVLAALEAHAADPPKSHRNAATLYIGRISGVPAWHDLLIDPIDPEFVDAYVAVAAASHDVHGFFDERLRLEIEGQVAYNFGDQSHWEFNVAAIPRWRDFPWNHRVATTVAFGLGVSMATEVPPVEVALESETKRLLAYWVLEMTLGPPKSRWAASLRLHHRSGAFGLFAEDGGMNAPSLGVRYAF